MRNYECFFWLLLQYFLFLHYEHKFINMARPIQKRKILRPPAFRAFGPLDRAEAGLEVAVLLLEEYEALRLCDYELMHQAEASEYLGVSRPTFTRIYESARRKVANAFVSGSRIVIQGGTVEYTTGWLGCSNCGGSFTMPHSVKQDSCPLCGSGEIHGLLI